MKRLWAVASLGAVAAGVSVIDNGVPVRDRFRNVVNAHDGNVFKHNGTYYWVGTSYTLCNMNASTACSFTPNITMLNIPNAPHCGWTNNDFAMYASTDLSTWSLLNPSVIPDSERPNGIYFRPKVVFNRATAKFVLWFNYVTEGLPDADCPASWGPLGAKGCKTVYGTAVADTPEGPYEVVQLPVMMGAKDAYQHGDFALFVDDDDKAYIMYNSYDKLFGMSVDLLTDDYTTSTRNNSGFFCSMSEAPVMIKTGPELYLGIAGPLCCFCEAGSTLPLYAAKSPLGPWRHTGLDLNPGKRLATQQSFALKLNESTYLWGGDRWQTSPYKAHDMYVWLPLAINASGYPQELVNVSRWGIVP
eukprot:Hpha_TRINITY_DN31661_c0_g1::TRINITY_DN31661_c0_g1_i1::g.29203::m.29203